MALPLFARLRGANSAPGAAPSSIGTRSNKSGSRSTSKSSGRSGVAPHSTNNAGSDVQVFQNYTLSGIGASNSWPLPADGDFNAAIFAVTVSADAATVAGDILNAFANNGIEIVGPHGPLMDLTPNIDFYAFQQRFGEYGVAPAPTNVAVNAGTITYSATYYVSGIQLPMSAGPYTLNITAAPSNVFGVTGTPAVTVSLNLVMGECPGGLVTHFKRNALPFTPQALGTQDLAPVAAIQGPTLQEMFLTGLTLNTADIAYLQVASSGSVLGTRTSGASLVGRDAASLAGTLNSSYLYPLLAFHTGLILDRSAHFYITWGATPSNVIQVGYYWLAVV